MSMSSPPRPDNVAHIRPVPAAPRQDARSVGNLALDRRAAAIAQFKELELSLDGHTRAMWCTLHPRGAPSYTQSLLREIPEMQRAVRDIAALESAEGRALKYYVLTSGIPGVFNLGGDLAFFADCIRAGNREDLTTYAHACANVLHLNTLALDLPIVMIALVNGDALGGGFESALAFDVIIAEKSAKFGLPEILFNLFPGMGAYSFLSRKLDAARAEKIILSGKIYGADELHQMGIVDIVAEDGRGRDTVNEYIRQNNRRHAAHVNICRVRRRVKPLLLEELRDITDIWVDAAMRMTEPDLRKMERLAASQARRLAEAQAKSR